jgi:hypothetical protein
MFGRSKSITLVSRWIPQHLEYFQHMRLALSFVAAPAHYGKFCVQSAIPAQFPAKGIITCVHHDGQFFFRVVYPQNFRFDFKWFYSVLKNQY